MGIPAAKAKKMLGDKYPKVVSGPGKPSPVNVFHSGMNKTESLYARRLDEQMLAGDVLSWSYETLTFRLANRCSYTPDFLVITPGEIQIHEVKGGYVREDGLIKWKIAAAAHPEFRFFMCKFDGGNWIIREYKS